MAGKINVIHLTKNGSLYIGGSFTNFNNYAQGDYIACTRDISTSTSTSETDPTTKIKLELFPNPAHEFVSAQLPATCELSQIRLYASTGQLFLEKSLQKGIKLDLDLSNVPSGIYIVQIFNEHNLLVATEKLIKI